MLTRFRSCSQDRKNEKGAILVLVAGAMVVLLGMAGLAFDLGMLYNVKTEIDPSTGNNVAPPGGNKFMADLIQVSITGYTFNFLVPIFGSGITLPAFTTTLNLEGLGAT